MIFSIQKSFILLFIVTFCDWHDSVVSFCLVCVMFKSIHRLSLFISSWCLLHWLFHSSRWVVFTLHFLFNFFFITFVHSNSSMCFMAIFDGNSAISLLSDKTCIWLSILTASPLRLSAWRRWRTSGHGSLSATPSADHTSCLPLQLMVAVWTGTTPGQAPPLPWFSHALVALTTVGGKCTFSA